VFNITFLQIETFLTVAKCLNLSKAGETLYASQPSLSKTLKRFEEGVGMRLFKSSNQGMALTSDGEYLFSVLEPLYSTIDKSIQYAQYNSTTPIKILRIVEPSTYDCMKDFDQLREIVKKYESKYPEVKVHEVLCDFKELRQALQFGNADIVFTENFAVREMSDISLRLLSPFVMHVTVSARHPLALSDTLDCSVLAKETLYTIPTMSDEQEDIETQLMSCRYIGFTPKRVEFLPNFASIMHAINMGKGFCVCAKLKNLGFDYDLKYFPIELPITPHIAVAWRKGRLNRETRSFIDLLPDERHDDSFKIRGEGLPA
jgi:DNA-binding transcriptional LysR family regulator